MSKTDKAGAQAPEAAPAAVQAEPHTGHGGGYVVEADGKRRRVEAPTKEPSDIKVSKDAKE